MYNRRFRTSEPHRVPGDSVCLGGWSRGKTVHVVTGGSAPYGSDGVGASGQVEPGVCPCLVVKLLGVWTIIEISQT